MKCPICSSRLLHRNEDSFFIMEYDSASVYDCESDTSHVFHKWPRQNLIHLHPNATTTTIESFGTYEPCKYSSTGWRLSKYIDVWHIVFNLNGVRHDVYCNSLEEYIRIEGSKTLISREFETVNQEDFLGKKGIFSKK